MTTKAMPPSKPTSGLSSASSLSALRYRSWPLSRSLRRSPRRLPPSLSSLRGLSSCTSGRPTGCCTVPRQRPSNTKKFLYLAAAGPYSANDRQRVLAERLEGLISQEHAKWTEARRKDSPTAATKSKKRLDQCFFGGQCGRNSQHYKFQERCARAGSCLV